MDRFSVVKVDGKIGFVDIPSKKFSAVDYRTGYQVEYQTLNLVRFKDRLSAVEDDRMEEVKDDWTKEFIKEIEQLYDE